MEVDALWKGAEEAFKDYPELSVQWPASADEALALLSANFHDAGLGMVEAFVQMAGKLGHTNSADYQIRVLWETEFFLLHMFDRVAANKLNPTSRLNVMNTVRRRVVNDTVEKFVNGMAEQPASDEVTGLVAERLNEAIELNEWYWRVQERALTLSPGGQLFFDVGTRVASLLGTTDIALIWGFSSGVGAELAALNLEQAVGCFQ
jgi:hypothetical protein